MQTISQVSRQFGISARMLRYYEQVGLIKSMRKEGYAYRIYDEQAVRRLRQIIVLRKLRVPVKQIIPILSHADAAETVEIFRQNIDTLDEEITALSTVKSILTRFVEEINEKADIKLRLLEDDTIFHMVSTLSFSDNQIKETTDGLSIKELNRANEDLMKLRDRDVRIVYLPPMTVVAAFAGGEDAEGKTGGMIQDFVRNKGLLDTKPDARCFGFDCSPTFQYAGAPSKLYEAWVTIPDDMEVPPPLVKRRFLGGLYAAHVLREWDFADWRRLREWVNESDRYTNDWGSPRWESKETDVGHGFEETLNFYHYAKNPIMSNMQLDLFFPVKTLGLVRQDIGQNTVFTADSDAITRRYQRQYDEVSYPLPQSLSLAEYRSVTVEGTSAEGRTAVKFYDQNGEETFVLYNNQGAEKTRWVYELNDQDRGKTIGAVGIMSQDAKAYTAVIHSIAWTK